MTVFKTFWSIMKRYKGTIILYTVLLIVFGAMNTKTNDIGTDFIDSKPDVHLIVLDETVGLTKNLVDYIGKNMNVVNLKESDYSVDDALFYREVNYVITIPKNYREDVLSGKEISLSIKSTGDYQASLAQMILNRYLKTQNILQSSFANEEVLLAKINESLEPKTEVSVISSLDTNELNRVTQYFNFASYSLMAVIIFIISLVLSSFHERHIHRRISVSSMKYKIHNRYILGASFLYAGIVFVLFSILGLILFPDVLFSVRGFFYLFNSFVFTFVALILSLFISNLVTNKEAVSGIVNVVSLGSAFLCGAFVPAEWLPESVLKIAHVLPTYWFIQGNEVLKVAETLGKESICSFCQNVGMLFLFGIFFFLLNSFVSRFKQKEMT